MAEQVIKISSARQHNRKNLHPAIPREKLVVVMRLSGSEESSLALDTLYAEGQRRYVVGTHRSKRFHYFLRSLRVYILWQLCDAKFYIIGEKAPPDVVVLATERIIVTRLQTDVRPFFHSVKYPLRRCVLAPV